MKAILINPHTREISEVEHDGTLEGIYRLTECSTVDVVHLGDDNRDGLFIDDEGMLKEEGQAFFVVQGAPNPVAGIALCLGCDAEGDSQQPVITRDELAARTSWLTELEARTRISDNSRATATAARMMGMTVEDCGNGVLFIHR